MLIREGVLGRGIRGGETEVFDCLNTSVRRVGGEKGAVIKGVIGDRRKGAQLRRRSFRDNTFVVGGIRDGLGVALLPEWLVLVIA